MRQILIAATLLLISSVSSFCFAADATTLVIPKITKPLVEAVENDPLQADYDKMWSEYEESVEKATNTVKEALDKQITKATDSGELDLVEMWEGKRKRFAEMGVLDWDTGSKASVEWKQTNPKVPYPREFNEAVRGAASGVDSAKQKLEEGYADLVKSYTKAKNVPRAKELRDEGAAVLAGNLPPAKSASGARNIAASSTSSGSDGQKASGRMQSLDAELSTVEKKLLGDWKSKSGKEGKSFDASHTVREWHADGKEFNRGVWVVQKDGRFIGTFRNQWSIEGQLAGDNAIEYTVFDPQHKVVETIQMFRAVEEGDAVAFAYNPGMDGISKAGKGVSKAAIAELEAMSGVWKVTAEHEFGRELTKDEMRKRNRHITIKGNTFSTDRVIGDKLGTYSGTIHIDAQSKAFDFKGNSPGGKPVEWIGIYKLNGDAFSLCYRIRGEGETPRPTEFKSLGDKPGTIMFECKREE